MFSVVKTYAMKNIYWLFASIFLASSMSFAQGDSFEQSYNPIKKELEEWDPIRGPWLASSLEAISNDQEIPDRTFPEDITPAQMVAVLPDNTRSSIERVAVASTGGSERDQTRWTKIRRVIVRPNVGCGTRTARSYGDPHIRTFDGARYSFQTVGEFVLTKSANGVEVQTRQQPMSNDFSLNTAVAMRMGSERVCIYADTPDGNRNTPVRVNGQPIAVNTNKAYFLRNGGTIRKSGSTYTVDWPTGEKMVAQMRRSGGMRFMNVNVQVSDCNSMGYDGLLGNANGFEGDDFQGLNDQASLRIPSGTDVFGVSRELEQRRLAYLANVMADQYRVTQMTSLFDYAPGTSTASFTDRSFPRVHRTLSEISPDRRLAARRRCEQSGVSGRDLNGCIFDNAHLGVAPEPVPVLEDPSQGVVFKPVDRPEPNVNPTKAEMAHEVQQVKDPVSTPLPTSSPKPMGAASSRPTSTSTPATRPSTSTTRPTSTPAPASKEPTSTRPTSVFGGSSGTTTRPTSPRPATRPSSPRPTSPVKITRPKPAPRPTAPSRPSRPTPKPTVKSSPTLRGGR